jgi:hypothetical protein
MYNACIQYIQNGCLAYCGRITCRQKWTHNNSKVNSRRIIVNVKDLQSILSETFCILPPPQLPQQRQHQKQQPQMRKLNAKSPPRIVTAIIAAHQVPNWGWTTHILFQKLTGVHTYTSDELKRIKSTITIVRSSSGAFLRIWKDAARHIKSIQLILDFTWRNRNSAVMQQQSEGWLVKQNVKWNAKCP